MRFGNDFEYTIQQDDKIDPQRVYIPSLLIQPFAENSLKHGLLHKKGSKKLWINFLKINNEIKIEIIDNGIGVKRAQEIKKRSQFNHKSFAADAVQNRINLLNKRGKYKININTTTAYEDAEYPGTKTTIHIRAIPD